MIKKLSLIFGSKTKAQEILLLQRFAKDVIRQGFYENELPKVEEFCKDNNLHLVKSNFKVLLSDETNYSNKGIRIPEKDKRPGMYFVYFSRDEEKAWLAAYYELMGNEKDLGITLGYPKCCVNFFLKNFSHQNSNPQHQPKNVWTNISKRDQDCVLLSHFPCSSECEESITLAKNNFKLIRMVDPQRIKEMVSLLNQFQSLPGNDLTP